MGGLERAWRAVRAGAQMVHETVAITATVATLALAFSRPLGRRLMNWEGVSPWWAVVPAAYVLARWSWLAGREVDKAGTALHRLRRQWLALDGHPAVNGADLFFAVRDRLTRGRDSGSLRL